MKRIELTPVEMTPEVMKDLEERELIIRLCPGRHKLAPAPGETLGHTVYDSNPSYGGHKLLAVTVNRTSFAAFGTHPDNEEFLMIGSPDTKPMYLVIALCMKDDLARKISAGSLEPADFVCLTVKYNDPEVSFFTMLADVPHGEAVAGTAGDTPSFYVTEPSDMGIEFTDFGDYELCVK